MIFFLLQPLNNIIKCLRGTMNHCHPELFIRRQRVRCICHVVVVKRESVITPRSRIFKESGIVRRERSISAICCQTRVRVFLIWTDLQQIVSRGEIDRWLNNCEQRVVSKLQCLIRVYWQRGEQLAKNWPLRGKSGLYRHRSRFDSFNRGEMFATRKEDLYSVLLSQRNMSCKRPVMLRGMQHWCTVKITRILLCWVTHHSHRRGFLWVKRVDRGDT